MIHSESFLEISIPSTDNCSGSTLPGASDMRSNEEFVVGNAPEFYSQT